MKFLVKYPNFGEGYLHHGFFREEPPSKILRAFLVEFPKFTCVIWHFRLWRIHWDMPTKFCWLVSLEINPWYEVVDLVYVKVLKRRGAMWSHASAKCRATRVRSLAIRDGKTTMTVRWIRKKPERKAATRHCALLGWWRRDGDAWKVVAETNHRLKQSIFGGFQSASIALEEFHAGFACCITYSRTRRWRKFQKVKTI